MSEAVPYRPSDLDALPVPLRVRLDTFRSDLRRTARAVGPAAAVPVTACADTFDRLLRDIGLAYAELARSLQTSPPEPSGPPLAVVPDPDPQQEAPPISDSGENGRNFEVFQRPRAGRSGRRAPTGAGRPTVATEGEGRLLPDPCTECGGQVYRAPHTVGRNPKRCAACRARPASREATGGHLATPAYLRAHPSPGMRRCCRCTHVFPDTDENFAPKGPTRDSMCRPCRGDYSAARYARAGSRVVTVEVLEGDPCVGQPCPLCGEPFCVGERIQGEAVHHDRCVPPEPKGP